MIGEWTPLLSGIFGALVAGAYLAGVYLLPKWRNGRGVAHSVDAGPVAWKFTTSQPTVTLTRPSLFHRFGRWVRVKVPKPSRADKRVVVKNPGDGMAVARLIMEVPTLAKVEALYADFQASPYKGTEEGQVHVSAARRIRQARAEGVQDIPWEFSTAAEEAARPFNRDAYRRAVFNLVNQFPEAGDIEGGS